MFVLIFAQNAVLMKNETIDSIQNSTAERITAELSSTMDVPPSINSINASFISLIDVSREPSLKLAKLQKFFIHELTVYPAANIIAVGLKNGEYREAQRLDDGTIRIGERGKYTGGGLNLWTIDPSENKKKLAQKVRNYTPSERPWYRSAVQAGKSTWSEVYFCSSNNNPAISGSEPLTDSAGNFLGVLTTSISLKDIGTFLAGIHLSPRSKVIITEPSGLLIAASDNQPLVTASGERINGIHAKDKATCLAVKEYSSNGNSASFHFDLNRERIHVKVLPFRGSHNLLWRIFIVCPEKDFTKALDRLTFRNFIFLIVMMVLGFFGTYRISKRITNPISVLSQYITTISFDSIDRWGGGIPPAIKSASVEIESLSNNFEIMMHRIKSAFESLEKSREAYRNLIENINSIIMKVAPDGTITYCNPYGLKFYGYKEEELVGKRVQDTILDTGDPAHNSILKKIFSQDSEFWNGENTNVTKDGRKVWILWSNKLVTDEEGKTVELFSIGQDITPRKETALKLEESLKEKNILLSEIHHRVKNNLQIIISLINLQQGGMPDKPTQKALQVIKTRIHSMALVHEMLYSSTSFSAIDLTGYIGTLARDIVQTFNTENRHIDLVCTAGSIMLNIDQAITLGLIVNEIISNAVKYAFEKVEKGVITIDLRELSPSEVSVVIRDNGVGTGPSKDIKPGLGTVLIEALADQLGAVLEKPEGEGTTLRLTFKRK